MSKLQKHRNDKNKGLASITALQAQLFNQLDSLQGQRPLLPDSDPFFSEFPENEVNSGYEAPAPPQTLLSKAKNLTYNNRGKIEKMKREIHRLEAGEGADFMTGVALFEKVSSPEWEPLDEGNMFRNLASQKLDDLQQLRRMIRNTEKNLRGYSRSVYHTQNKVVRAADKIGHQIEAGLAIKINKCSLDQMFGKESKARAAVTASSEKIRRRASNSDPWRKLN